MDVYSVNKVSALLEGNSYPGRGIILGNTADGKKRVAAYFIMGRSVNSRNRVFIEECDGIRTEAKDPALMKDPHLIIYHPVREIGNDLIVTNGDQTDTIYDFVKEGKTFSEALETREFEPDAPNYTPRISGIIRRENNDMNYALSILKSAAGDGSSCQRYSFAYSNPIAGKAKFIHTYTNEGDPLPSFEGEPKTLELPDVDIDTLTDLIWTNLNEDNKVSLFVRYIDIETGEAETRIVNKNV